MNEKMYMSQWLTDVMSGNYNTLLHLTSLGVILLILIITIVILPTGITMYMMFRSHPYSKPKTSFRRHNKANREIRVWRMK